MRVWYIGAVYGTDQNGEDFLKMAKVYTSNMKSAEDAILNNVEPGSTIKSAGVCLFADSEEMNPVGIRTAEEASREAHTRRRRPAPSGS